MRPEDIEGIRRSLAMSPTLPGDLAQELLAEVIRLRAVLDDAYEVLSAGLDGSRREHPSAKLSHRT